MNQAADTLMGIFKYHRTTDPETSKEAAERVPEFAGCHKAKILETLDKIGSGTVYEIAQHTGIDAHRLGRRIKELETSGMIECLKIGTKLLTRKTPSGRNARVWVKV